MKKTWRTSPPILFYPITLGHHQKEQLSDTDGRDAETFEASVFDVNCRFYTFF